MSIFRLVYILRKIIWKIFSPTTVGVRAILLKNDKVLLVKHSYSDMWYLPGGGVKKGESIDKAIVRELEEELGVNILSLKLFGAYSNFFENKNDHIIIFYSEEFTILNKKSNEISEWNYYKIDRLPDNISPGSRRRIEEFVRSEWCNFGKW